MNGLATSHHQLHTEALMAPNRQQQFRNPDRRRFSVSDLHQAWRVEESPSPISAMYNQQPISIVETPVRRKNRYQVWVKRVFTYVCTLVNHNEFGIVDFQVLQRKVVIIFGSQCKAENSYTLHVRKFDV